MTVDVAGLTAAGQSLAGQLMVDEGTISRPGAGSTLDDETGDSTPNAATVVYSGPCRVRMSSLLEQVQISGDRQVTVIRMVVSFPASVSDVRVGDLVAITKSADARLTSRGFRVTSVTARTVLMYRQVGLETIE